MFAKNLLMVWLSLCLVVVSAAAQEQVVNGDFESGQSAWQGGTVVADAPAPHGGVACLQVNDNSADSSIAAYTASLIPIDSSMAYSFSVWVLGESAGQQALVTINQYDSAGQWISGHNMDFVVETGAGWTNYAIDIQRFSPVTTQLRIMLRPVRWTSSGELLGQAWFDDVSLVAHPREEHVYGQWLRQADAAHRVGLWQAPVEYKVRRDRFPDVSAQQSSLNVDASRNEYVPMQIVLAPEENSSLQQAELVDFSGPGGAVFPSSSITWRQLAYVNISDPTDWGSVDGLTADPLPELTLPLALQAGQQQPLWLTLHVDDSLPAGTYSGQVHLVFGGEIASEVNIPVNLQLRDFSLPEQHHLRTAYGLSLNNIDRYHNLDHDPDKRRQVLRAYLRDFAAHRVSPYDPMGDADYVVQYSNLNWSFADRVEDPEDPGSGNHVVQVIDDDTNNSESLAALRSVAVDPQQNLSYSLSWRAKTDGVSDYLVSLGQYDAQGQWISGHNLDFVRSGDGTWLDEQATISADRLASQCRSLRLRLFARPWTSAGELTGQTWFDDFSLVAQGQTDNLIIDADVETNINDLEVEIDFSAFDEAASYALDELGMDSFRLDLPGFGRGSIQGHSPGRLLGYDWQSPEYRSLFGKIIQAISAHLAAKGWLDKAYAYWFDEPNEADYAFVNYGMDLLHDFAPGINRILTEQGESELYGHVDTWVPVLHNYSPAWAQPRQGLGEHVWWYVCTSPKSPYPGNFIDHSGVETRLRFWMAWHYGIEGSLYWQTNYWTTDAVFAPPDVQDPWTDPQSYTSRDGVVHTWGNGDGRLLYPPRDWADGVERLTGPVPSIRWELIREGIEDYELLWMMQDLARQLEALGAGASLRSSAQDLAEMNPDIFFDTSHFAADPQVLQQRRSDILSLVEEMQQLVLSLSADAGLADVAIADSGMTDAAMADSAVLDVAHVDAAFADALQSDLATQIVDAGPAETDAQGRDSSAGDAALADSSSSVLDVLRFDSLTRDQNFADQQNSVDADLGQAQAPGCQCQAAAGSAPSWMGLVLALAFVYRRRQGRWS